MFSLAIATAATILLLRQLRRLQGTTMLMPWAWSLLAFWSLAAVDLFDGSEAMGFLLSAAALCPGMAWMGARRPHDRAWQLIVASLWLVIVLPALRELALPSAGEFSIHILRQLFLLLLVAVVALAVLPTRFGLPGLLLLAGQLVLWSPYISWLAIPGVDQSVLIANGLFLAGLLLASVLPARRPVERWPATRLWLDYRDTFGGFWAMRLMDRVNRAAHQEGWEFQLGWDGFSVAEGQLLEQLPLQQRNDLHQYLRNIIRRFADPGWIDERLDQPSRPFASTHIVN